MIDPVDQTLRRWRTVPFDYGDHDCMLSIGDYITLRGGADVTTRFRGTYDTEDEARALMIAHGGAAGLIDLTGISRIEGEPERGDVAAVQVGNDVIGGICTGGMVAMRLVRGVGEVALRFVQLKGVWRCPR